MNKIVCFVCSMVLTASLCFASTVDVSAPRSISDGITSLLGSGGTVYVESGIYEITETISVPNNVHIVGIGNVVVVPIAFVQNVFLFSAVSNSSIENITIRPENTECIGTGIILWNGATNCSIANCTLSGFSGVGIVIQQNCSNNTVKDCRCVAVNTGLYVSGSNNNKIIDNYFVNSFDRVNGYAGMLIEKSNGNLVTGNHSMNNKGSGLYLSGSQENVVSGNVFSNNYSSGIHVRYASAGADTIQDKNNTIIGNECSYNGVGNPTKGVGIFLQDYANHNIVSGNVCNGNAATGIRLRGTGNTKNLIGGNIVTGNTDGQISIETSGNTNVNNITN